MLENILTELAETWDFTAEELSDIRSKILHYAEGVLLSDAVGEDYEMECRAGF